MTNHDLFGNEIIENKTIDRDELTEILKNNFRGIDEIELVSMLYSKFEAIIDFYKLCNGEKTGEKISMLFNPHRYDTKTVNSKSIIEALKDEKFFSGLSRAIVYRAFVEKIKTEILLYRSFEFGGGVNGVQYVNEFHPHIARKYYMLFNAKRVLDPCAGWGGRMIGAASCGIHYHGFEPATKTFDGLVELGNFLKTFKTGFTFQIENSPFEDAEIIGEYDLALTSPPYYDTELYSEEETNSCNRYKTFDEWCEKFYKVLLAKTLKHTNKFIINVGSRKYDLKGKLFNFYPNAREIKSMLSGKGGLGKQSSGKESFYLIESSDNNITSATSGHP